VLRRLDKGRLGEQSARQVPPPRDDLQQEKAIERYSGRLGFGTGCEQMLVCAQTLLLSDELCQVALPKGSGLGSKLISDCVGAQEMMMICCACPKRFVNRVASGRAALTVQEAPMPEASKHIPACLLRDPQECGVSDGRRYRDRK